jgi:type 1 glutamine amidotransferase
LNDTILGIASGLFHPSIAARSRLIQSLSDFHINWISSLEQILAFDRDRYAAMIIYLHRQHISREALDALIRFVERGGGLLALHSASASFKREKEYRNLLGGRFVSHGPVMNIRIEPEPGGEKLFGVTKPFTIRDELYVHEYGDDVSVRFSTMHEGKKEPVAWIREFGQGRVCYLAPGHRGATFTHPSMKTLLEKGLEWIMNTEKLGG